MSEIIKLYENVGIEKRLLCGDRGRDVLCGHVRPDGKSRMAFGCFGCEYKNDAYPPFTAEKQIELIKWAARTGEPKVEIGYSSVYGYWVENYTDTRYYFGEQFDSALASLINSIWQDLTEEEKQQIKDILK